MRDGLKNEGIWFDMYNRYRNRGDLYPALNGEKYFASRFNLYKDVLGEVIDVLYKEQGLTPSEVPIVFSLLPHQSKRK